MNMSKIAGTGVIAAGAIMAMVAFVAISAGVSAQTDAVRVGSASSTAGSSASVSLSAVGISAPGLGAWSVDIVYDPAVVTATGCTADNGSVCNDAFDLDTVRVVGASAAGLEGDSNLADISFSCDATGTSALALTVNTFSDATPGDLQPIDPAIEEGTITCAANASGGNGSIRITSGQAAVGAQDVVDLEALDMVAPGLGAWTVDIGYDDSIATATACLPANGGVCNAGFADGTIRATGANANGLQGDNMLAQVTFRCDADGTSDLTLTLQVLVDATVGDPQFIDASVLEGTLACGAAAAGPTATVVPGTTPMPAPPDAGTGDFGASDAGYFGLLVAGLIGAGLAWLIAGFAGARFAPADGLRVSGPAPSAAARTERDGKRWFESARRDLTHRGLPSAIRFRRVGEREDKTD